MKNINLILIISLFFGFKALAQTPAPAQSQPIVITGATAHLGNGKVIENSTIVFENGKITSITTDAPTVGANWKTINASGKHVYPGLIAGNTQLGLQEIDAVRATRDARELGMNNANIRALIAYNTDSHVTQTCKTNGILLGQIVPQGGLVSGLSSLVELDAWNWEDAAYKIDEGIHINWPSPTKWKGSWYDGNLRQVKNDEYGQQVAKVEDLLAQAKAYNAKPADKKNNLKLNALARIFSKESKLYVHVKDAQGITSLVAFKQKHQDVDVVIVGGQESYKVADLLAKNNISVILHPTQALPFREDEDIDQPFKTPKILHDAGVLFAIAGEGSWQQRNLPFFAGQAVGFGLPYEVAVQAVTENPAKIMGIAQTVGTLEVGKDATLIISEGDVLDMRTSKIETAFIRGKILDLNNKQKALYNKYKAKYEQSRK